jgi:hypothetical protein
MPKDRPGRVLPHFLMNMYVKMGYFLLDLSIKIGYCKYMFRDIVFFVLRISLIVALWAFVWKFIEPKTQLMRILRAALLVLGLLVVLTMLKITGQ